MTTLSELHTYWHQQFDILHAQDDTPLRNWRLMAWLSFQLPLALDTSVPFYKDVGPYWCDTVYNIMRGRFDNIEKATISENEVYDQFWNIDNSALIALSEAGSKVVAPPSHMEKNLAKIEAYKQQKTVLKQFLHSFYHAQTPNFYDQTSTILQMTYDKVQPLINTIKRNEEIMKKSHEILRVGGFGAVSAQHGVSNQSLTDAMDRLLDSLMLIQKEEMPTTVAGLDGCNICFYHSDVHLGSFSPVRNSIHMNVKNKDPAVFWHEWMHMLEERSNFTTSLQQCPPQWDKYRRITPHIIEINKVVRTLPQDLNSANLYFDSGSFNPFFSLINEVKKLCNTTWFNETVRVPLLNELNNNVQNPTYNLEVFKQILRNNESVEQRDALIVNLLNQWRNVGETELDAGDILCAQHYDTRKNQLVNFHKELKNKKSNFVSAAKVLDREESSLYWSSQQELLARAFESFVHDQWMNHEQFSEYHPNGRELDQVVQGFETFMQDFKTVWNNQPVAQVAALNTTKISDKRSAPAIVKKRLTRF